MTESKALQTATMAEIYANQGDVHQAVRIYRQLLDQMPHRLDWQRRLAAMEQKLANEDSLAGLRKRVDTLMGSWIRLQIRYMSLKKMQRILSGN